MSTILRAKGGWWHDYVCPTHGVELDPAVDSVYPCRHGCRFTGDRFAGAWVVLEHQARAREARLLARRYSTTGDASDRTRAVAILTDFADFYAVVAQAGKSEHAEAWMLPGKLFSQALTEAIWAVQIADAVRCLSQDSVARQELSDSVGDMLNQVLDTVAQAWVCIVEDRDEPTSNYVAWLDAAGTLVSRAMAAFGVSSPEAVAQPALWRERTLDHLTVSVADDGWEWEGSTYYHLFVLHAYLLGLQGTDPADIPAETLNRLAAMVEVLAGVASPDGALPALHDGPYDRTTAHLEVLEICVLARQVWEHPPVEHIERWVRARVQGTFDGLEDTLGGWFTGIPRPWPRPHDPSASAYFPSVGYVALRNSENTLAAILDAGPHGGSHGHLDKLGLYLYGDGVAWQPAPGVPPYGNPLRLGYYSRTRAHPTVRINDEDQLPSTGSVDLFETGETSRVVATSDSAVEGVRLTREVVSTPSYLLDIVQVWVVEAPEERDMTLALRPAVPLAVTAEDALFRTVWSGPHGTNLHGTHRATCPSSLVASPGRGPSDDPSKTLAVGDWSTHGSYVAYVSAYTVGHRTIENLDLIGSDTDADAPNELRRVRIHLSTATTHEHEVTP